MLSPKMGRPMGASGSSPHEATVTPTTRDLYWAAGFLEGEGYFGHTGGSEVVRAPQVNPEPVERLLKLFGGRVTLNKRKTPAGNDTQYWVWQVSGARARGVMMTLYSLLSNKRQAQIETASPRRQTVN